MSGGVRDYKPGQEAFYHGDDGAVYKVRVLKNNSDLDHEIYSLTILEVIQRSNIESRTLQIGDEFKREKLIHPLWELLNKRATK